MYLHYCLYSLFVLANIFLFSDTFQNDQKENKRQVDHTYDELLFKVTIRQNPQLSLKLLKSHGENVFNIKNRVLNIFKITLNSSNKR